MALRATDRVWHCRHPFAWSLSAACTLAERVVLILVKMKMKEESRAGEVRSGGALIMQLCGRSWEPECTYTFWLTFALLRRMRLLRDRFTLKSSLYLRSSIC